MNRAYATIIALAAGAMPMAAQRLDGCAQEKSSGSGIPLTHIGASSREAMDRGLQEAGVALTRGGLTVGLGNARADVRSLAAEKLGEIGKREDLEPLLQAWVEEKDDCTRFAIDTALDVLMHGLAYDPKQHPNGQPWITPFRACKAPDPALVTLTVEQATSQYYDGPLVRITARNQTYKILPFAKGHPADLFLVTVLDPTGAPAKVTKLREDMFKPVPGLFAQQVMFIPLQPQEDVLFWDWRIGEDFDLSAPGIYYVSLGGKISFLDTTICSNTAEVKVEK